MALNTGGVVVRGRKEGREERRKRRKARSELQIWRKEKQGRRKMEREKRLSFLSDVLFLFSEEVINDDLSIYFIFK